MNFWEWIERFWLVIALSCAGGLARAVNQREKGICAYLGACVVAVFAGTVTFMLINDLSGLTDWQKQGIASLSAYSGGALLDAMRDRFAGLADIIIGGANRKDK